MLSAECLHRSALRHVPHTDSLVLAARDDELMARMEQRTGHIVEMPAHSINLPCLGVAHAPELDLAVISRRDDERQRRMELRPVHAAVVTLKHIFDGRERIEGLEPTGCRVRRALAQTGDVPDAHGLVHRCRDNEVLLRVEEGRHDVMGVSSQNGDAVSRRAVPDANSLVVRR